MKKRSSFIILRLYPEDKKRLEKEAGFKVFSKFIRQKLGCQ